LKVNEFLKIMMWMQHKSASSYLCVPVW